MQTQTLSAPVKLNSHWSQTALFYHIYALGMCGAPARANQDGAAPRLNQLYDWIPYWQQLGVNTLLLGPISASGSHGYDTSDLFRIDGRLGNEESFAELVKVLHQNGIRVVLDGVFNHVGRDFFAFRELLADPQHSPYRDWFYVSEGRSGHGDPFRYGCWEGHEELVRLNLACQGVRDYLLGAVSHWIQDYGIDGLRLDVAYCLDPEFLGLLAAHCRRLKPDFWLMGEIIHGDYQPLLNQLDAVTNYECYKGLWSSHKDRNCFEIAHSLQRMFGHGGLYRGRNLYNFADNHDVDRVASRLDDQAHLSSLYMLLMTMPGVPSIYYGSELGLSGSKIGGNDAPLRPMLEISQASQQAGDLFELISALAEIRQQVPALQHGDYTEVAIRSEQFSFVRETSDSACLVAINLSNQPADIRLDKLTSALSGRWRDALHLGFVCELAPGTALPLPASGGRILLPDSDMF